MADRKFDNQDFILPNGGVARIGTYMDSNGKMSIKLRLPSDYWHVTTIFRGADGTNYKDGKFLITIDQE